MRKLLLLQNSRFSRSLGSRAIWIFALTVLTLMMVMTLASPALADSLSGASGPMPEPESNDLFSRALRKGGVFVGFGAAYLAGLAACATPCVYPMVGITVSVFGAKQAKSRRESAMLSGLFVLGIAALYTPLGLAVALSNSVWGRALSNPWITVALGVLFAAMAASMFGAFEISLPSSVQNKLATVGGVGPKGAFLIGLVSGLIASPCTTAPFASILGSFSKSGVAAGTTSVFLFSLGLGTPFFIVGTFAARLPKPGAWMQYVKSFFGIVLLVIALYYVKNVIPLLRAAAFPGMLFLYVAIAAIVVGLLSGAIHLSFGEGSVFQRLRKAFGIGSATWGGYAMIAWLSLEPSSHIEGLAGLIRSDLDVKLAPAGSAAGLPGTDGSARPATAVVRPVVWSSDPDKILAEAKSAGRPVIVDFTASWCAACKEMEKTTFVDPTFWKSAANFSATRIDGSDEDAPIFKAYATKYAVKGLPVVLLLDSKGEVAEVFRKRIDAPELVAAMAKVK